MTIYAVLSNLDIHVKFTVKNQNKDFINRGTGSSFYETFQKNLLSKHIIKETTGCLSLIP